MTAGDPLRSGSPIRALLLFLAGFAVSLAAAAAPVPFPTQTFTVTLDGIALGQALHPSSLNSLRYTVTFNPGDGLYHLWVLNGGDSQTPADMQVSDVTHATSTDGISFTSRGKLNPPASWWTAIPGVGASVEPSVNFLRVDKLNGEWFLTIWSPNETNTGLYNYNANVWDIGSNINNLNIVQHGPLPTLSDTPPGPGGDFVGSFGMLNGNIYLRQDTPYNAGPPVTGGGIGRYIYTDGVRPTLSPLFGTSEAGMFSGTPYCWPLGNPNPCLSPQASYVHNSGRLIANGSAIGAYYSFRDFATGARQDKQIWFVESDDDGLTWSAPLGIYPDGNAVQVDGLPNGGNFSSPELTAARTGVRVYFSTTTNGGSLVVVSGPPDAPLAATPVPALSPAGLAAVAVLLLIGARSAIVRRRRSAITRDARAACRNSRL
jgi:hypothetical protein